MSRFAVLVFSFVAVLGMGGVQPAWAVTLVTDGGGQLTGARDVSVGGVLYDVDFVDGTCIEVFSGCDEDADFSFDKNGTLALSAMEALLDQVFTGIFDDVPSLTLGCEGTLRCDVWTPVVASSTSVSAVTLRNFSHNPSDNVENNSIARNVDFVSALNPPGSTDATWARWQVSTVPLPAAGWMLLTVLAGFAWVGRQRKTLA